MKQQFVVTHRYTSLQLTGNTRRIFNRPRNKRVTVLRKYKDELSVLWTQHFDRRRVCKPTE